MYIPINGTDCGLLSRSKLLGIEFISPSISNRFTGAAFEVVFEDIGGSQLLLKFRRSISGTGFGAIPSIMLWVRVGLAEWSLSDLSLPNYRNIKDIKFIHETVLAHILECNSIHILKINKKYNYIYNLQYYKILSKKLE